MNTRFTTGDQQFFFNIANQILNRFNLLANVDEDIIDDYIINYSDLIVNQFIALFNYNENYNLQNQNQ